MENEKNLDLDVWTSVLSLDPMSWKRRQILSFQKHPHVTHLIHRILWRVNEKIEVKCFIACKMPLQILFVVVMVTFKYSHEILKLWYLDQLLTLSKSFRGWEMSSTVCYLRNHLALIPILQTSLLSFSFTLLLLPL